jgi:sec-independent protein translocase protein TatC
MRLVPKFLRRSEEERTGTMTVVEHLEELRRRLIIAFIAVGLGSIVGWFLYPYFMDLIRAPFCDYVTQHPEARPPAGCDLVITGLIDPFIVKMKIVVYLGLAVALPVVLWQVWAFVNPGLTEGERKYAIPFVASSTVLFFLGAAFAYWTLPRALNFLLGFAGAGITPILTADRYVSFIVLVTLAFGLSFLFPVLLVFLELVGILSSRRLRSWRRYSILFISIFAAVITPSSDPYTMLAMMIPMYVFYEAAIIIGRLMKK